MSLENFLDKMFCAFMSSTARMEKQTGKKVEQNLREAKKNYDDKDKESVEAYKKAFENVKEFQQTKVAFDRNHAALQHEYDRLKKKQNDNIQKQKEANYHYQGAMNKSAQEQRNTNQIKQSSEMDIQERREFFNVTLPRMVNSIVSSGEAVKKVSRSDETDNNSEESDQGNQQYKEDFAEKVELEEKKRSNSASQNKGSYANTEIPTSSNNIKLCRGSKRNLRQHHRTSRNNRRKRDSYR
jgi:hypothetical protein